jgi:hypothetical protein
MAAKKKGGSKLKLAAALVGAAAAGFYLYGPKGKENRVKLKAWTLKAKGDVLEQFEKRSEVTEEQYHEIVDKVTAKYGKLKSVGTSEANKLNRELKRHWRSIQSAAQEKPAKKRTAKKR